MTRSAPVATSTRKPSTPGKKSSKHLVLKRNNKPRSSPTRDNSPRKKKKGVRDTKHRDLKEKESIQSHSSLRKLMSKKGSHTRQAVSSTPREQAQKPQPKTQNSNASPVQGRSMHDDGHRSSAKSSSRTHRRRKEDANHAHASHKKDARSPTLDKQTVADVPTTNKSNRQTSEGRNAQKRLAAKNSKASSQKKRILGHLHKLRKFTLFPTAHKAENSKKRSTKKPLEVNDDATVNNRQHKLQNTKLKLKSSRSNHQKNEKRKTKSSSTTKQKKNRILPIKKKNLSRSQERKAGGKVETYINDTGSRKDSDVKSAAGQANDEILGQSTHLPLNAGHSSKPSKKKNKTNTVWDSKKKAQSTTAINTNKSITNPAKTSRSEHVPPSLAASEVPPNSPHIIQPTTTKNVNQDLLSRPISGISSAVSPKTSNSLNSASVSIRKRNSPLIAKSSKLDLWHRLRSHVASKHFKKRVPNINDSITNAVKTPQSEHSHSMLHKSPTNLAPASEVRPNSPHIIRPPTAKNGNRDLLSHTISGRSPAESLKTHSSLTSSVSIRNKNALLNAKSSKLDLWQRLRSRVASKHFKKRVPNTNDSITKDITTSHSENSYIMLHKSPTNLAPSNSPHIIRPMTAKNGNRDLLSHTYAGRSSAASLKTPNSLTSSVSIRNKNAPLNAKSSKLGLWQRLRSHVASKHFKKRVPGLRKKISKHTSISKLSKKSSNTTRTRSAKSATATSSKSNKPYTKKNFKPSLWTKIRYRIKNRTLNQHKHRSEETKMAKSSESSLNLLYSRHSSPHSPDNIFTLSPLSIDDAKHSLTEFSSITPSGTSTCVFYTLDKQPTSSTGMMSLKQYCTTSLKTGSNSLLSLNSLEIWPE